MLSDPTGTPTWNGTETCPFCGDEIPDPGAGFIAHTRDSPACRSAFDGWRERLRSDMRGEWSG
jgi:hypothetical protein